MSIETEAIRIRGLKYHKRLTHKFRRMGNVPSNVIVYYNPRQKVYLLYWMGNRIDEISKKGKEPDLRDIHKMQRHFGIVQHGDHYKFTLSDLEYKEKQDKIKAQELQDEKTRYMANEVFKYGVKGSQSPSLPSVVVDGTKKES